jgi:alkyl sulfatase BDS1-like metallo-beta-lactamase superfamily hydrolase
MSQTESVSKPASAHVIAAQAKFLQELPLDDRQDFGDANRGFIDSIEDGEYLSAGGRPAWSLKPYAFLKAETAPDSINPSLWRQAQLNMIHGLFEVVKGVYQVRGIDLANMTIVEGKTGIIVIDTLSTQEGAAAALALYRKNRGDRLVKAVIITHTHTDHWGGCLGVASSEDYSSGRIPLIAPDQFIEHAVSENVMAGNAMRRRALYQFGPFLKKGPLGHVDNGLGKTFAFGRVGLAAPNDLIMATGDIRVLDGVTFEFQMAPDTEAPAEMHMFLPEFGVLNLAENAVHNFHNLLPFRGAQVRNSLNWTTYISEAISLWGEKAEVLIGQHHWPVWGQHKVADYLKIQRDLYKFVHDQTLRMINAGQTPQEIAETIRLPKSIENTWHARGYYGSLRHNVKGIYQHYIGWYDAVPANLDPLPPVQTGAKMIEYMGGIDAAVAKAQVDFDAGNYRWVAQVMNHAVFSDPAHQGARDLLSAAYEQLGYLAECATWRNAYLFGAQELRLGIPSLPNRQRLTIETLAALASAQVFDLLGTRLDSTAAEDLHIVIAVNFTDRAEHHLLNLENAALTHIAADPGTLAQLTITTTRPVFDQILLKALAPPDAIKSGALAFTGDITRFAALFSLFVETGLDFAIVEP